MDEVFCSVCLMELSEEEKDEFEDICYDCVDDQEGRASARDMGNDPDLSERYQIEDYSEIYA